MYSEMIEYQSTKRFGNDISYLDKLDTKELAQRNDELVRRLTGAVGELKKFKDGLDLFSPWMENAQKKLIEKEKYLTDFDKIDNCFESTTIFVSDVIEHQADLNSIANSAKNFINQFKSYLGYSKEYRSLPPRKRARIESLSTMEDELSDVVASITSEFRELLLRVHGLLSNELSGLSVKQKKYKEAVNAAGIWLKGAERRTNEILSEPVSTDDVSVLKSQLSRTLAINAEFVSQERLIGDAKKVLEILLRSLEGQLSPDEMTDVKNPIIEIENKYSCLLKSLNERCQTLDIVLLGLKPVHVKDASNDVHSKSPVSISEKNTGVAQNDTEEERRDEVESSIDGQNIKFNTESTSLETTEELSRNGFEKEIIPGSETPTSEETNIESNTEGWKDDELEEGEYVSPVESPSKDLEKKIDDKSETSANESSSETSSMIRKLLNYAEDISEDSLADDKSDQEEGINTVPEVPTNEHSCVISPPMLKEISQDDIRGDKNGAEGENNITPEIPTSVDKTSGGPVLSDKTSGGPELSDSTASGPKLSDVLESQKSVGSNTKISESMLVDFISDSECLSFEDGEKILVDDLLDKSSLRPETPGTSASESKIVTYSESSSFEELPQNELENGSSSTSATLTIQQIVETCMEYSSSKAAENGSKNTSVEVMDVFSKNNLEEESSLNPVIPTTNQNVDCTSVEVINDALVNILAEDLDCLAKQIDVLTKQIDESEKMIEVSFGAETSSIKSQLESFIIHQETEVFKKPEDIALQSEVNNNVEDGREDFSDSTRLVDTASKSQSEKNNITTENRKLSSQQNTITSGKIDDLLKKHLLTRQPVILLHDICKTLTKQAVRRESQNSVKYNLRFPKADELCLKTSKKDSSQKAKSLLQKKKPFKVDLKKHPVSLLQEYCCYYNLSLPRYHFKKKRSSFLVSVVVKNKKYTAKEDLSKKKGKMEAAKLCLQHLRLLPKS